MIVFLDSCTIIYAVEGDATTQQAVTNALYTLKTQHTKCVLAVSRLALMECRVKPLRNRNASLLAAYDSLFAQTQIAELTADVVTLATRLRTEYGLKTPDALQAACALSMSGELVFLTGDAGFDRVHELNKLRIC